MSGWVVFGFIAAWYLSGALGSLLIYGIWWRDKLDVTVEECVLGALVAWAGPLMLIVGILLAGSTLFPRFFHVSGGVVWKRRE